MARPGRRRPPAAGRLLAAAIAVLLLAIGAAAPAGGWRVLQHDAVWWLADARGQRLFSFGVNVVDRGVPRKAYRDDEPAYAAFRAYATADAWAAATATRLRRWGFNTLGGWSESALVQAAAPERPFPVMPVLDLGRRAGVPWTDIFASTLDTQLQRDAVGLVRPWRTDPHVAGYFLDNELGWWGDTLFVFTLKQPATSASRRRLLELLRERYRRFADLQRDFVTDAASFDELSARGTLQVKAGGRGLDVVDEFLGLAAERYYRLASAALRRAAPGALVLGDRYPGFYEWPIARAAGRHLDVVSTNYGSEWPDGRFTRYFLDALHVLSSKPILVSEIYVAARENRSGNRNTGGLFPTVDTQADRAAAARRQVEALARRPYVVGAHWFQYYDEPTFGRADGEDYNMGLVDIHDAPYEEITRALASLDLHRLHARSAAPPAKTPPAPAAAGEALDSWDLARAFVEPSRRDPHADAFADLYVAWRPEALLLGLATAGFADRALYAGGVVTPESRFRVRVRHADGAASDVDIGPHAWLGDAVPSGARSGGCRNTRCTAVIAIPAARLAPAPAVLAAGRSVALDVELTYRGRRMVWKRTVTLGAS